MTEATLPAMSGDGPQLPEVSINLVRPKEPVVGRVVATRSCMQGKSASFVRHVEFDVSGTLLEGAVAAGQAFGVLAPGEDERGKPHALRLYSTASPSFGEDGKGCIISTTVKRLIDERSPQKESEDPDDHSLFLGVCSNFLCDLRVGDEVRMTGPSGKRFLLPVDRGAHDYVFIATGTGIAPFRAMVQELLCGQTVTSSRVFLLMGAPYRTDLLYDEELRALADQHEQFTYCTALSREPYLDTGRGRYVDQCLRHELADCAGVLASDRTLIYICGIAGMENGVYAALVEAGVADGYVSIPDDVPADPGKWDRAARKLLRHGPRCFVEVY